MIHSSVVSYQDGLRADFRAAREQLIRRLAEVSVQFINFSGIPGPHEDTQIYNAIAFMSDPVTGQIEIDRVAQDIYKMAGRALPEQRRMLMQTVSDKYALVAAHHMKRLSDIYYTVSDIAPKLGVMYLKP